MKEIWKDVIGYKNFYKVSNKGRVKSLNRIIIRGNGSPQTIKSRILKSPNNPAGYPVINLSKNGVITNRLIHQLVAESFLNHKVNGFKLVVDHIDFDKTNNNLTNLRIITQRENTSQSHLKATSKYVGVSWSSRKRNWRSAIILNGKCKFLGGFKTEHEAHVAYQKALYNINAFGCI